MSDNEGSHGRESPPATGAARDQRPAADVRSAVETALFAAVVLAVSAVAFGAPAAAGPADELAPVGDTGGGPVQVGSGSSDDGTVALVNTTVTEHAALAGAVRGPGATVVNGSTATTTRAARDGRRTPSRDTLLPYGPVGIDRVTTANTAPTVSTNTGSTTDEGTDDIITQSELETTDPEQGPSSITYTVDTDVSEGQLFTTAPGRRITIEQSDTFTQAEINNGYIEYDHDGTEPVSESFDFTVRDGNGGSATGTFSITINQVNDAPTISGDKSLSTDEGTADTLTSTDLEADDPDDSGSALTYTVTNAPTNGQVEVSGSPASSFTEADLNNGNVEYVHDGSETTADSFSVELADDDGGTSANRTIDVSVNSVNDQPTVVTNAGSTVNQGSINDIIQSELETTDTESGPSSLTYTIDTDVASGQIQNTGIGVQLNQADEFTQADVNNGYIEYRHDGSETTSDYFDFTVRDGDGGSATGTFSISINDAPSISGDLGLSISEGGAVTLTSTDLEADDSTDSGSDLTYTVTSAPANGYIEVNGSPASSFTEADLNNGNVAYVHDGTETVSDSFDVKLEDDRGATSSTQTVSVSISSVNDAPSISGDLALSTDEGTDVTLTSTDLEGTDPDDSDANISFTVTSTPANGNIMVGNNDQDFFSESQLDSGYVRYVHDGSETTADSFDVELEDDSGANSSIETVSVSVNPVNDAPSISGDGSLSTNSGGAVTLTSTDLEATDPDDSGSALTYTVTSAPADGTVEVNGAAASIFTEADLDGGLVEYVHDGSATVSDSFDVEVADDDGATSGTQTVSVTDDIPPTLTGSTPSDGSNLHPPGDDITLTFDEDIQEGNGFIVLTDEDDGSSSKSMDVANDSITFSGDTLIVDRPGGLESDTDYNVDIESGAVEDDNANGFSGSGFSDPGVLNFRTADTDPEFTAGSSTSITLDEDTTADLTDELEVSDVSSSDTLAWSVATAPGNGGLSGIDSETESVSGSNSPHTLSTSPTYTPNPDVNGADSFDVEVSDTNPGSVTDTITVSVTIDAVNDAPSFSLPSNPDQTVGADTTQQTVAGFVDTATFDPGPNEGGQSISDFTVSNDDNNLFSTQPDIANDGDLTYTPADNVVGTATVDVQVVDDGGTGNGGTDTSTTRQFDITVDNRDPTFSDGTSATGSVTEGTTGSVLDVDGDDDTGTDFDTNVTYALGSSVGDDANFSIDSATGQLSLDSPQDFEGPSDSDGNGDYELTVTATDDAGNSRTQSITVSPTDVDETPTFTSGTTASVSESATGGTSVLDIEANVGGNADEGVSYAITAGNADSAYAIDSSTGQLTVNDTSEIDYEASTSRTVTVAASEGSQSTTQDVTISVDDADESPVFTSGTTPSIAEDDGDTTTVLDVDASVGGDADEGIDTYQFDSGNGDGAFAIDSSGRITIADATQLDHEVSATRSVTVRASEGGQSSTQSIDIGVTDVDETPSFAGVGSQTVAESDSAGTTVVDIDADVNANGNTPVDTGVSYAITAGNDDVAGDDGGAFAIDNTGQITVDDVDHIDESVQSSFTLTVAASEGSQSATQDVTISVTDDVGPTLESSTPGDGTSSFLTADDITLTFDENVSLGSGDVRIVDDGDGSSTETLSVTGSAVTRTGRTVTVDPTSELEPVTDYHVEVDSTAVDDQFGNSYAGISSATALAFTTADTAPSFTGATGGTISVTVTEDDTLDLTSALEVTDISRSDTLTFAVASAPGNGSLAGIDGETLATDGGSFTLGSTPTYTPDPDFAGSASPDDSFDVTVTDSAGNAATATVAVDVRPVNDAPTVTVGANQTANAVTSQQTVPGFAAFDPGGGSDERSQSVLDYLVSNDDTSLFSTQPDIADNGDLTYTPAAGVEGTATVDVQVVDDGGTSNGGTDTSATERFNITVDTRAPTVANASVDGDTLTIITDESLSTTASAIPDADDFNVTADGRTEPVDTVSVSESTVTLTLSYGVSAGQTVTLNYTQDTDLLQDSAGNPVANFTGQSVTNDTPDPGPRPAPDETAPTADAGADRSVTPGTAVTLNAGGSTDNRELGTIQWDVDDDGSYERTGRTVTRSFQQPGEHTVRVRVWDESSNYDTDTVTVTVAAASTATATPTTTTPAPTTTTGPMVTQQTPATPQFTTDTDGSTPGPASTNTPAAGTPGDATGGGDTPASTDGPTESGTDAPTESGSGTTGEPSGTQPSAADASPTRSSTPGDRVTTTSGPGFGFVAVALALALLVGLAARRAD